MAGAPSIGARGTAPEKRLEAALRRLGIDTDQYERGPHDVAGRPDFFFRHVTPRAVVCFVDGCLFHGCPIHARPATDPKHALSADSIARTKLRDKSLRAALANAGYRVIAFWEHDIEGRADRCAAQIAEAVRA